MPPPAEISIPTTSTSPATSDSKAFTLYNITLRLPLRSFVTQKRYNEFVALHASLCSLVGTPPPAPLPGKSWFRSTINSPEMTEARRAGLEKYLKAIADHPDRRWRDTPAWRAFLNLPSSTSNSAASASGIESRLPAIGLAGANAAAASDPSTWIDLHKEMKKALHDARLQLARRDAAVESGAGNRNNTAAVEAGAAAKRELIKAGSLISALGDGIRTLQEAKKLGEGEIRRRKDLLAAARVERDGLEKLSASLATGRGGGVSEGTPNAGDKTALLGNGAGASSRRSGGRVLGAPLPETERTRELDNQGVLQLQKQTLDEQEQDVESLMKIVRRQKEMGLAIKSEIDLQDEMLDHMNMDADRVMRKVDIAKDRVKRF